MMSVFAQNVVALKILATARAMVKKNCKNGSCGWIFKKMYQNGGPENLSRKQYNENYYTNSEFENRSNKMCLQVSVAFFGEGGGVNRSSSFLSE